jgi:hypothetical protein
LSAVVGEAYALAQVSGTAVVLGVGGNVGVGTWEFLGISGGASIGIAVDPSGNVGIAVNGRLGGGFSRASGSYYSAGANITRSRQQTIFGLNGNSAVMGVSVGFNGFGGSVNTNTSGAVTVTLGSAGGFGTFGGVSGTRVKPLICAQ